MDGTITVGRRVRQAVERHLWDLDHASNRRIYFDERKAEAAILWFSVALKHVEGEWAGKPVELTDNQAFIIWCVMGWRNADGNRRFRHVYISCARKWGKSTLAAGIGLMLLTFDDPLEPGAQVYCAATKEDQAKIVHRLAQNMANASDLVKSQARTLAKSIVTKPDSLQPNSFFKPLGSDSKTSDGFNVHVAVLDEIHEWRTKQHQGLWDKLNTAHGSRRQALIITITTAGDDTSEIWSNVDDLCCQSLDGYKQDNPPGDHRFAFVARLDEKRDCDCGGNVDCIRCDGTGTIEADDPFDEANWPKANPNFPITPKPEFLREQAADAKLSPANKHAFLRYHCNVKVSSLSKAIDSGTWSRAQGQLSDWSEADVVCGGWDLGGEDDLGALARVARFETDEKSEDGDPVYRYEIDATGYINAENSRDIAKEPWCNWRRDGILVVSPMELAAMKTAVKKYHRDDYVRQWAYDPHTSRDFAQSLEADGVECIKFFQNASMWTEPLLKFLVDLKQGRITHNGNGLLTWSAGNLVTFNMSRSSQNLVMPDKRNSTEKIDPIIAVIMAYRLASVAPAKSKGKLFVYG